MYAVGYAHTESAYSRITGQDVAAALSDAPADGPVTTPPPSAATPLPATPPAPSRGDRGQLPAPTPTPTPRPAAPSQQQQAGTYRDGTFTGLGTSRHGNIEATVVIKGGKIVSATVTSCQTRFPCSWVSPLVTEVVSRQSAPVDYVSGATDSSRAYRQAVSNALARAGAA